MALIFKDVVGDVPLVQRVWSAHCEATTVFTSAAKPSTLISFARYRNQISMHVHGPETSATQMPCPEGWEFFGVELKPGAHLPLYPARGLIDLNDALLPILSNNRILLDGLEWEMPSEQNVDIFIKRLVRSGLLVFDPLIDQMRHGERPQSLSERTAQLRFSRAVGISHRTFVNIERAQHTAQLLIKGKSIAEAVDLGGYYDQPQLSRAMRWATGHTPGELRSLTSFLAF